MTLSSLKVIPLLQAFSSAIFRICGASRSPSSAELLVAFCIVSSSAVIRIVVTMSFRVHVVDNCAPYCILDLVNTRSPKSSPSESPRGSPVNRRRSSKQSELSVLTEPDDFRQTAMVKAQNGSVNWSEKFEMYVKNFSLFAICRPSDCTVVSGVVVVVGVCNCFQMRTSNYACLIFGVSIGLEPG